jgi:hypothetical protein
MCCPARTALTTFSRSSIGNGFITATAILILSVLYLPAICCSPLLSLKAEYNRTKSLKPELGLWLNLAKLIQP